MAAAFWQYAGVDVNEVLRAGRFDEILVTEIEPHLGRERPVFLYDFPVELGSLARCSRQNPAVAERFELYIAGIELANGFSELVDAQEQRQRFELERAQLRSAGREAGQPEKFLAELHLMGETAGIALGFDRLCMFFMGSPDISEVMPFIFEEL